MGVILYQHIMARDKERNLSEEVPSRVDGRTGQELFLRESFPLSCTVSH